MRISVGQIIRATLNPFPDCEALSSIIRKLNDPDTDLMNITLVVDNLMESSAAQLAETHTDCETSLFAAVESIKSRW